MKHTELPWKIVPRLNIDQSNLGTRIAGPDGNLVCSFGSYLAPFKNAIDNAVFIIQACHSYAIAAALYEELTEDVEGLRDEIEALDEFKLAWRRAHEEG